MSEESAEQSAKEFLADLNARINPERSRAFDRKRLEASRETLFALSRELWPQARGERISIVGSNGKGSTAWYLAALAESRAHRANADADADADAAARNRQIGLYTSPHLTSPLERIRLDRAPIAADAALAGLRRLATMLGDYADFSYFEILTLLAWDLFQSGDCPVQIFEAGLGGRFDATRIARADTVVLTRIDLEHTQILGETPRAILTEKLGIVSPECRQVFYGPQSALRADEVEAEIRRLAPDARIHAWQPAAVEARNFEDYLAENLAYARFVFETLRETGEADALLPPTADSKAAAVPESKPVVHAASIAPPPGRLERRELPGTETSVVFFDVAHNPASILRSLRDLAGRPDFPGNSACELRLGVLKDRDPVECLAAARDAGFRRARLLSGGDLASWSEILQNQIQDRLPEMQIEAEPVDQADRPPALPGPGVRAVIVLGSHRIYNYFVELTTGGEKTDPDL